MGWNQLTTKTKATIVVVGGALIWLTGVTGAVAAIGSVATHSMAAVAESAPRQDVPAARPTREAVTPTPTPAVEVRTESVDAPIPFTAESFEDASLPKGQTKVTTAGVDGVETTTYRVEYIDGVETKRVETAKSVTTQPITQVTAVGTYVAPAAPAPAPRTAPQQQAAPSTQSATITPGALCADADNGRVAQAATGKSYQCGGKGPDANGRLHWNTMG